MTEASETDRGAGPASIATVAPFIQGFGTLFDETPGEAIDSAETASVPARSILQSIESQDLPTLQALQQSQSDAEPQQPSANAPGARDWQILAELSSPQSQASVASEAFPDPQPPSNWQTPDAPPSSPDSQDPQTPPPAPPGQDHDPAPNSPPSPPSAQTRPSGWFLGLDLAAQGLGVVLLHRPTQTPYPLSWIAPQGAAQAGQANCYDRLPVTVYFGLESHASQPTLPPHIRIGTPPQDWGSNTAPAGPVLRVDAAHQGLDLGLPYYEVNTQSWEPVLQVLDPNTPAQTHPAPVTLPLVWVRKALDALLQCLNPQREHWGWQREAIGLDAAALDQALGQLDGIGVTLPHVASEAYAFNVREAILGAGLVQQADQVYFLETAIAALLPTLHQQIQQQMQQQVRAQQTAPQGAPIETTLQAGPTLVLNLERGQTALALVELPAATLMPRAEDFIHGRLPHGEQAIDQDIISQLLSPLLPTGQLDYNPQQFPVPGEADLVHRFRFHHYLSHSPLGTLLSEAATQLRLVLQNQDSFTLRIGPSTHSLARTDLVAKVLQPFCYCLNPLINQLLSHAGWSRETIGQVLVMGSPSLIPQLQTWLHQKFPQAQIIHTITTAHTTHPLAIDSANTQSGVNAVGQSQPPSPGRSLGQSPGTLGSVALGLALLPLYPQLFNTASQYSNLFLLLEIVRCQGNEVLTLSQICQRLETRGINTYLCQGQIYTLVKSQSLPSGLVPDSAVAGYFTPESWHHSTYATLRSQPFFTQPTPTTYQINPALFPTFQHYWQTLIAQSWQTLEEPYLWSLWQLPSP